MTSESLRGENIINGWAIVNRLDYLAFLDDDEMSDDDRDLWADEIEELRDIRAMVENLEDIDSSLISEDYWEEYTRNEANEAFDLEKTGADVYFAYDQYADDLRADYSIVKFGDDTYYYS